MPLIENRPRYFTSSAQDVHGMLAGNDLEASISGTGFEIGEDVTLCMGVSGTGFEIGQGRAGAYAAHAANHQAWRNRWLTAVGWVPIPRAFPNTPQINTVHWFSPVEYQRMMTGWSPGRVTRENADAVAAIAQTQPIRDVRGYIVLPATWSPDWHPRTPSTHDFNRRPPAGSAARPEPTEHGAYLPATGSGAGRRRHTLIRMR